MAIAVTAPTATWNGSTATGVAITSGSFTPTNGSLLVVVFRARDTPSASISNSACTDTQGNTYTMRAHIGYLDNTKQCYVSIFTTVIGTGVSMTVSTSCTQGSGGSVTQSASVFQVTGQHASPIGTTGTGTITSQPTNIAIFSNTASGSRGFWGVADDNAVTSVTSSDSTVQEYDVPATQCHVGAFRTADFGAPGAVTANFGSTGTPNGNWAALEILAAGGAAATPRMSMMGLG